MKRSLNPWVLVAALWVVGCLNYLDRQVIFSVLPLVRADLHMSSVELGLLGTAFLWVYAALSPVCGYVADRFGRRRVIVTSLFVWSLVTWATGQARSAGELLGARAFMGVSEAFYLPAALALISERHGEKSRSLATGIHTSGVYAGMILGGAGGGWLGQRYGWRYAFTFLGLAGIAYLAVLAPALARTREAATPQRPQFLKSLRELWRLPGFPAMLAVFMAFSLANWMLYTWLPLYLYERFRMSLAGAGLFSTYVHVASICGVLAGGWVADRWGARSRRGRLLAQSAGILACAPSLFLVGFTSSWLVLAASLVFYGIGKGFYDCNCMPVLCQIARSDLRATGYGIFNLGGCLAGGVSAPLAGYLKATIGIEGCLEIAAFVVLLSAVPLLRIRLPLKEPVEGWAAW